MNVKLLAFSALCAIGIPAVLRRMRNPGLSVLMFHGLSDRTHSGMENSFGLHLNSRAFEDLCRRLSAAYRVLPLGEAADILRRGKSLPRRAVALTFDDGYESNLRLGLPLLRQYQLPATVFLATDFVHNSCPLWPDRIEYALEHTRLPRLVMSLEGHSYDWPISTVMEKQAAAGRLCALFKTIPQEDLYPSVEILEQALGCALGKMPEWPDVYRPLNWQQVRTLADSGLVGIGAHTHAHRILGRCRDMSTVRAELDLSRRLISENAGIEPDLFAYPNGQPGDHTAATRQALIEHGFRCAVTTEPGFNKMDGSSDALALRRFGQPSSPSHLDAVVSGALDLVGRSRRWLQRRALARQTMPA